MPCTRRASRGARLGAPEDRRARVLHVAQAAQRQRDVELLLDQLERERDAALAERAQPVGVGAADHHGARAERERPQHVLPAADAAVEPHFDLAVHRLHNLRQRPDRRDRAVELAAAVVGDHDRVGPRLRRELRVLGVEDALDDQLAAPELLHPLHVFPRQRRVELPGDPLRQGGEALRIRDAAFEVAEGFSLAAQHVQRPARFGQDIQGGREGECAAARPGRSSGPGGAGPGSAGRA